MSSLRIYNINKTEREDNFFSLDELMPFNKEKLAKYGKYYNGAEDALSERELLELKVLDILFKLGFPREKDGTYLFQDVIIKAIHYLDGFDDFNHPISEEELLKQMQTKYSQFYFEIARNEMDMGVKTFHSYISRAIKRVNYSCVDSNLLSEVYGDFREKTDYGKHAFIIAKNIRNHNNVNQVRQNQDGKVQYVKTKVD